MIDPERKDGGPAFPMPYSTDEHDNPCNSTLAEHGMTLRDWFAGQMLVGMSTWSPDGITMNHEARAHWAYAQADAMLDAREPSHD